MDRIRLDDVAARVVAWHNRHPLAQRVAIAHVHGIGEVELPFAVDGQALAAMPEPPEVPERGLAAWRARRAHRRRRAMLHALFSERFIESLAPRRVARWARTHAVLTSIVPADWPRRTISTDARIALRERSRGRAQEIDLHLLSAAIGLGNRQLRVLVGAAGEVLGARAYAPARIAGACAACAAIGVWLAAFVPLGADARSPAPVVAAAAASAAFAASAASPAQPASAPVVVARASAAAGPDEASPPPQSASAPGPQARSVQPDEAAPGGHSQTLTRVSIRPPLSDEERRVAIETGQRLREAARLGPGPPSAGAGAAASAAPASAPRGPVYALVAPPTRRRDESLALLDGARSLQAMNVAPPRSDVFAARGMWRAAFWPFESLAEAERARIVLAGKGLKAEVVEF